VAGFETSDPCGVFPMSKNDVDAVDREYRKWVSQRGAGLTGVDPFEYFCADLFLKPYLLSDEDIRAGLVGKSDDGGTDAFYFLLNGQFVQEDTKIPSEAREQPVNLIFIQAKHENGFSPLSVDRFDTLTDDIFALDRTPDKYGRTYNGDLLFRIKLFKEKYQQLSMPKLTIDYYYIIAADIDENEDCRKSAAKILETAKKHFGRATINPFHFVNAAKLYTQLEKRAPRVKDLKFAEWADAAEGWVGLVGLRDFFDFLKDDKGNRNDALFDDNVRGVQYSTINKSIYDSLTNSAEVPEFWLLNNGITILSPKVQPQTHRTLQIEDPQIVNGLQTARQIFTYFSDPNQTFPQNDNRRILVKVIQNSDENVRDTIIKATNNQNPMPAEALFTTFRIHKQIERVFRDEGLFYERRKGYYRDRKEPVEKIVSAGLLLQAVISIMKYQPDDARGRPKDYITDQQKRYSIFGHDDYDDSKPITDPEVSKNKPYDIAVYLNCVRVVRRIDAFLSVTKIPLTNEDKRNIRFYLARHIACVVTKNAYCPPVDVANIDAHSITDDMIEKCLKRVRRLYRRHGGNDEAGKSKELALAHNRILIRELSPPNRKRRKKKIGARK
jgi:hypothetical protein